METWAGVMVKVVAVEQMTPLPGGEIPGVKLRVEAGTRQIWAFYSPAKTEMLIRDFKSLLGRVIQLTKAELRTSAAGKASLMIKAFAPPALRRVLRCSCGLLLWSESTVSTSTLVSLTVSMIQQSALILNEGFSLSPVSCRQCGALVGHYIHAAPPQLRHWRKLVQAPLTSFTTEEVTADNPQVSEIPKTQSQVELDMTLDLEILREFSRLKIQVANKCQLHC